MTDSSYSKESGHPELAKLEDGTEVRHVFERGDHAGETSIGEIQGGHILYSGEKHSPTSAARAALRDIRGQAYETNGWKWWQYDVDGEWMNLEKVRE